MGQFLRMKEVGPEKPALQPGDRVWIMLFAESPPQNSLQSNFFLLHLAQFQTSFFLTLSVSISAAYSEKLFIR